MRKLKSLSHALALAAGLALAPGARADLMGLPVHGFMDAGYLQTQQTDSGNGNTGFRLGTLDLYLAPELGGRLKALAEVVWEFDSWYNNGQPDTDVERFQIGYTLSNDMTLWIGRFHTPYGVWNTAFHHGAQLQTTILRPQFLAFEDHGGILPAHTVGLWLTGHHAFGSDRLTYDAYYGNGSRILPDNGGRGQLDMNSVGDDNGNRAIGGRFGYQFGGGPLDGLWVGVHGLKEEVDSYLNGGAIATSRTDLQMEGVFAQYDPENFELLTEYYHFNNRDLEPGGTSHSSYAGYVQLSYIVQGRFTPYLRYESTSFDQLDTYFEHQDGGLTYKRVLGGLRYDIDPAVALKAEISNTDETRDGGQRYNELRFQAAVRF
jgi:hypothetical protein